jgi:hypothetical protein
MKKNKRNIIIEVMVICATILPTIFLVGYTTPTPPADPYADPPGNIWGVRENDDIRWSIADTYSMYTIDTNAYVDHTGTFTNWTRIGTPGNMNWTVKFYNTTYTHNNLTVYFEYSNSTQGFKKIRIYRRYYNLFEEINFAMEEYTTADLGGSNNLTLNYTSQHPYYVRIQVRVYVNTSSSYSEYLYGLFLPHPRSLSQYKEYSMNLKAEIMKIEDSPTDSDNISDLFLMSSYEVGPQGFTFDIPDYLDTGLIFWILGQLLGISGDDYLFFPSSMRIVTSMIPYVLMGNQSASYRALELLTFYNIHMLPTNFDWSLLYDLADLLNFVLGFVGWILFGTPLIGQPIQVINTTTEAGLVFSEGTFLVAEDMQYGNCSLAAKVIWDKTNGLAKEYGLSMNYYDIGIQRDITLKLTHTTMTDVYPTPPDSLIPENINAAIIWLIVILIIIAGISIAALVISLRNRMTKAPKMSPGKMNRSSF